MFRLLVFISFLGFSSSALASPKDCERSLLGMGSKLRPITPSMAKSEPAKNQSIRASENVKRLSAYFGGRVNPEALENARASSYRIELKTRLSLSSKAVQISLDQMINSLLANASSFEAQRSRAKSADHLALMNAKFELMGLTAQLITLGNNRYIGTNPDLVLARDAFARQVETGVKMSSVTSTAKLAEVIEHMDFIRAILREKQGNPFLSDAEATARGVEIAYKDSFVKRCKDGSCKIPSDDVLAAGAKTRLEEMKDCI